MYDIRDELHIDAPEAPSVDQSLSHANPHLVLSLSDELRD